MLAERAATRRAPSVARAPAPVPARAGGGLDAAAVRRLQRTAGNRAVARALGQACCATCARQATGAGADEERLRSPRFAQDDLLQEVFRDRARLRLGMRSESVRKVQQALLDVGAVTGNRYDLGSMGADGWYGSRTAEAVERFKADEQLGFAEYGDVGPGTMHRLDQLLSGRSSHVREYPRRETPTSTAKVEVKATPAGFAGGPWHLYIVHTDDQGRRTAFRSGPGVCPNGRRPDGDFSIMADAGPYDEHFIDWDPSAPTVIALYGEKARGKEACLGAQLNAIDKACVPYAKMGPNSNTTARDLLKHCGIPEVKPVEHAIGWADEIPGI